MEGFHDSSGYICMALSERNHPSNYTALHELAHAIAYTEHGLTGHNKIFQETLVKLARQFKDSECRTDDYRLRTFIDLYTPIIHSTSPHVTENPLFIFCYGATTAQSSPTTPLPTLVPTPTPPIIPENRFLELRYDASQTINNRQSPAQMKCTGGSSSTTMWSRTLDVQNSAAYIEDSNWNRLQITQLDFALIHPGRRYSDTFCPESKLHTSATLVNRTGTGPADLTGYIAEWQDSNGNHIASDNAEDGISIRIALDANPEALYSQPARLLIYDQYTQGSQPTPTPEPVVTTEQKAITMELDPTEWEVNGSREERSSHSRWTEVYKASPDIPDDIPAIYDVNVQPWHIKGIYVIEQHNKQGRYQENFTEYTIVLTNSSRAFADFTGYQVTLTRLDGSGSTGGAWQNLTEQQKIGRTQFNARIRTEMQGPMTLRIWDTYEPGLQTK